MSPRPRTTVKKNCASGTVKPKFVAPNLPNPAYSLLHPINLPHQKRAAPSITHNPSSKKVPRKTIGGKAKK